jgi:hypothetical protein
MREKDMTFWEIDKRGKRLKCALLAVAPAMMLIS